MLKLTVDIFARDKAAWFWLGAYLLRCWFLPANIVSQPSRIGIAADSTYLSTLLEADATTFQREFEFPWLAILDPETIQSYSKVDSLSARKRFIRSYWNRCQPNPLSPQNELLQAFLQRWSYVTQHFSTSSPPFFDDRGKFYLKYGEPSIRHRDSGGRKSVSLFKDRQYYQLLSRLYSGFPPAEEYFVYPNESWVYRRLGPDAVIHFVKQGERFEQVPSLTRAIEGGIAKNIAWYWSDMIQHRAHLSPAFARAANVALEVQNDLYLPRSARTDARMPHERLLEQKKTLEIELLQNQALTPAFLVPLPTTSTQLQFFADVAQFRGPGNSTRLEISFLVPFPTDPIRHQTSPDTFIEYRGLIRDQGFDPIHQQSDTCYYSADYYDRFANAIGELEFCTQPLPGDLTLQVHMIGAEKMGYSKQQLVARDFSSRQLMISDIRLFYAPDQFDAIPASIIRLIDGVRVMPYPYQQIQTRQATSCYFEIYNLISAGLREQFAVKIELLKEKGHPTGWKKLIQWLAGTKAPAISIQQVRSIRGDNDWELIAIDFSQVQPGHYLLQVTVTDCNDPMRMAITRKPIQLVK